MYITPIQITQGSGGSLLIETETLGADTASIDFTGIPATYTDLLIIVYGRSAIASSLDFWNIRFNNDSGSNYDSQILQGESTSVQAFETIAQSSLGSTVYVATGNTAASGAAAALTLYVPKYAETTFRKTVTGHGAAPLVEGQIYTYSAAGQWRDTSAITRVTLLANGGNLLAGTSMTLYGLD